MKRIHLLLSVLCCSLFLGIGKTNAQIALQYTDTTLCPGQPLTMCASLTGQATNITQDDVWSGVLNLGFTFKYFDQTYTQCIVTGNGLISFNLAYAGQAGANWTWGQSSASGQCNNTIMATFCDLYPQPGQGLIRYQRFGQAGSRRFVVEWCDVPIYSGTCQQLRVTTQLILYEGSNRIEVHTTELPPMSFSGPCPSASGGYYAQVVQGLRNSNGTASVYPTNRGPAVSATNWGVTGATNDGIRFTPNGATSYIIDSIPFNPWVIIDSISSPDLKWYKKGDLNLPIATGACASVVTDANIDYYVVNFSGNAGCQNANVSFSDTVHIHFGTSYDTTSVEICAGSTYSWFGKTLFKAGNYDTLLSTQMGCDSFLRLKLTVNPLPDVTLKGSTNMGICEGSSTILALANPKSGNTYQWYRDGYPVSGETGPTISVSTAGKYTVEATTTKGCKATSQAFTIVVNPNPVAKIEPISDEVICAYDTLELIAEQGTSLDYRWSPEKPFRTITGAESQKVKGVFIEPVNEVVLTVFNQYGCYDSDTVTVETKPCCQVFAPNAFSPNGDGSNDYFKPVLQPGQILLTMRIFDRYGKQVYNNENVRQGWNGAYQDGKEAPAGVYMFYMKYTCADGKLYEKKESVTLIR